MPRDALENLNPQQRDAVEHGIGQDRCPPLLVIAGAGTGKTMTLACRVARLVLAGADPNRILLLTFSRRAAREMGRRVGQVLHRAYELRSTQALPELPWSGTFHAIGARLLRDHARSIGLSPQFTIHDHGDAEDLIGLVREQLGFASTEKRFPTRGTCLAIYSRIVNGCMPLNAAVARHFPWCIGWEAELAQLFRAYIEAKQAQRMLDYDDLLLYWRQAMEAPAVAEAIRARFDHVLVDEYQDTNRLQAEIVMRLKPDGAHLTVVGDDAQSIYAFRAAEVRNILDFPAAFTPAARVISLERNYRSTQPILDASNAVIALAAERHAKRLWSTEAGEKPRLVTLDDEAAQASWVAAEVLRLREEGIALRRQAVLFRTAHHSAALEVELVRRDIPFVKYGGLKFLEAAHVKDLLAVLRWLQNPRSQLAGFRVAQLVPGIGPASARRLLDAMQSADDPIAAMRAFEAPAAAGDAWQEWIAAADAIGTLAWPQDLHRALRWYRPQLERLHEDAAIRLGDLDQLVRIAAGYGSRERFLAELTLDPPAATSDEPEGDRRDDDYLILSTMHSAKGQEWTAVFVLNAVDGCIPSDMATDDAAAIEEERRLLYVALTRAKRHLALVVPLRFHVTQQRKRGDRHLYASLTRFVPQALQTCFDAVAIAAPGGHAAEAVAGDAAAADVLAQVRGLF